MTQYKILVVDDNADIRELLEILLTSEGYAVTLASSGEQALQLLSPEQAKPKVACAKVYAIEGDGVTGEMMEAVAHHVINPVEARRASMEKPETLEMQADVPADVAVIEGFTQMSDKALGEMVARMGMAMSAEDLCAKMIEQFTSMTFDGLTGNGMTWNEQGQVTKSPKGMVIQNGAYVGLD